jgi:ABC-2 type transport system permease protein
VNGEALLDRPPATPPRHAGTTGGAPRVIHLTYTLAVTEWKLRFFDSALGYLWTVVRPLLMFGVLFVVFSEVAEFATIPHYAVYLLMGIVLFWFFQEATSTAVRCLVERETLLRKIRFPRMVVPLSVVLTAIFNLGTNLVVLLAFLLANGVAPRWSWLQLPVMLAVLLALTTGTALLLSVLFVNYRDVQPIWDVVAQILFYGSAILYPVSQFGEFAKYVVLTPIAALVTEARHALIDPAAPSVADVAGHAAAPLVPLGVCLAVLGLGIAVFRRAEPHLAEDL